MQWIERVSAGNWALFVVTFLVVAAWESFQPKRPLQWPAERRWGRHAILLAISGVFMTAAFRISPVVLAASVANSHIGLLNRDWLPFGVRCAVTILLLDLLNYAAHKAFHSVSFLWRVHEVHHSDPDYDVSTAARFHPIEVVVVQGAHLAVIALLAPPAIAVFIAGLLTEVLNLFVHANASLPVRMERWLRIVVITPDLHRIHHSEDIWEQQRNLGQTFAFWDRLFGTYADQPQAGRETNTGLKGFQNAESFGLAFMLAEPFHSRPQPQPGAISAD